MVEQKFNKLNEHATGIALAGTALLWGLVGLIWHGPFGQPTMMAAMYPGFSWFTVLGVGVWVVVTIFAYVTGYLFANIYNWALKKK